MSNFLPLRSEVPAGRPSRGQLNTVTPYRTSPAKSGADTCRKQEHDDEKQISNNVPDCLSALFSQAQQRSEELNNLSSRYDESCVPYPEQIAQLYRSLGYDELLDSSPELGSWLHVSLPNSQTGQVCSTTLSDQAESASESSQDMLPGTEINKSIEVLDKTRMSSGDSGYGSGCSSFRSHVTDAATPCFSEQSIIYQEGKVQTAKESCATDKPNSERSLKAERRYKILRKTPIRVHFRHAKKNRSASCSTLGTSKLSLEGNESLIDNFRQTDISSNSCANAEESKGETSLSSAGFNILDLRLESLEQSVLKGHDQLLLVKSNGAPPVIMDRDQSDDQKHLPSGNCLGPDSFESNSSQSEDSGNSLPSSPQCYDEVIMARAKHDVLVPIMREVYAVVHPSGDSQGEQSGKSGNTNANASAAKAGSCKEGHPTRKRSKQTDVPSADEDENEDRRRERKLSLWKHSQGDTPRLFACPFHKYDPFKYRPTTETGSKYRTCVGPGFKSISRLK